MIEKLEQPTAAGEALHEFYSKLYILQNSNFGSAKNRERKINCLCAEYRWLERLLIDRGMGSLPRDYMLLKHFYVAAAHAYHLQRIRKPVDPTSEYVEDEVVKHDVRKYETAYNGGTHYLSAFNDYRASEINDTLSERTGFLIADNDIIRHEDDVGTCERTGAIVDLDDLCTVVISIDRWGAPDDTEQWCERARDNGAFWCEASEEWYSSSDFTACDYASGGYICQEYAVADGRYMWSDRCGFYVYERDWDSSVHDWEEEDRYSEFMRDYHGASKHHFGSRIAIAKRSTRLFFGYEVELVFDDFDSREQFMRECREQGLHDVVFERDSSLQAADEGVELIFPPYALSELRDPEGDFARVLQIANDNRSMTPEECGVHITINLDTMLAAHREQFIRAVYALHRVSVYVAQRDTDKFTNRTSYASYKKYGGTKYAAINRRDNGAYEIRIFAGSDDVATLVSYAEYIDAVRDWVRTPDAPIFESYSARADAMTTAAFRRFVTANRHTYPNLAARFGRQLKEAA